MKGGAAAGGGLRRAAALSVAAGVGAALLVVGGGVAFLLTQPSRWSARATAIVLPQEGLSQQQQASYYEVLNGGQIVETFAEMLRLERLEVEATEGIGLSDAELAVVTTSVEVVPETTVIAVTTEASDASTAESLAEAITREWSTYLEEFSTPYEASVVNDGRGTGEPTGPSRPLFLGILGFVAIVAGVACQQAVYHLVSSLAGGRSEVVGTGSSVKDAGTLRDSASAEESESGGFFGREGASSAEPHRAQTTSSEP